MGKLKYKIYRCYEVRIEDKDGNQIGESEYIYTDRKDAKKRAEEMLKEAENESEVHHYLNHTMLLDV